MFQLFKKNKGALKAVFDEDLVKYLKSVGLYEDIISGSYLCIYCGNKITLENLEVIVPKSSRVEIVCNNKNCLNQL
jgi:hypothetical protein